MSPQSPRHHYVSHRTWLQASLALNVVLASALFLVVKFGSLAHSPLACTTAGTTIKVQHSVQSVGTTTPTTGTTSTFAPLSTPSKPAISSSSISAIDSSTEELSALMGEAALDDPPKTTTTKTTSSSNSTKNIKYPLPANGQVDPVPIQNVVKAFYDANGKRSADFQSRMTQDPGWKASINSTGAVCPITSKMVFYKKPKRQAQTPDRWILATYTSKNTFKRNWGGDEIYVQYTANGETQPTAVAMVTDKKNGNYALEFVQTPTHAAAAAADNNLQQTNTNGTMTVILEQSCRMGQISPPLKAKWNWTGAINQFYTLPNTIQPTLTPFPRPNADGAIDFANYETVILVGDSTMGQLVCINHYDSNCPTQPGVPQNLLYRLQARSSLNLDTWKDYLNETRIALTANLKTTTKKLKTRHAKGKIAVVLNSGIWDLLADEQGTGGPDFEYHIQACRQLVQAVQEEFPSVTVLWKSMTAVHIHVIPKTFKDWYHGRRVYYMSNFRARKIYDLQMELMADLQIPVLDLFQTTYLAAHKMRPGDGRHYTEDFNQLMLSYFYPNR